VSEGEKRLRIRVVGKGYQLRDYKVYDADTGEELTNILRMTVDFDPNAELDVVATLVLADVEVEAEAIVAD